MLLQAVPAMLAAPVPMFLSSLLHQVSHDVHATCCVVMPGEVCTCHFQLPAANPAGGVAMCMLHAGTAARVINSRPASSMEWRDRCCKGPCQILLIL